MSTIPLQDRVAVVTGSMGGLGSALVTQFASEGWRVVAAARKPGASEHPEVLPIELDVTNRLQAAAVIDEILARWGRVDALINNAGAIADAPLWETEDSAFDELISVNLNGAFMCSQMVLRPMIKQREGHILNIASFSGRIG